MIKGYGVEKPHFFLFYISDKKNMDLPVYKAQIDGEDTGMYTVSLVDFPAVESNFQYFDKDVKPMTFAVEDEEQRIVTGVVMRCDFPIYRRDENGYEYYIIYDKPTIEVMAEKWLAEGFANSVNLMHDADRYVDGVYLKEVYFKDADRGIAPKGFDDITDGSMFASYKVMNDEVWESIKSGEFKGFSLEGWFSVKRVETPEEMAENALIDEILGMLDEIKNKVK